MKRIAFIVWLGLVMVSVASGEETSTLRELETKLRQSFRDVEAIDYRFDNADRTLVVDFKTRKFLVHGRSKSGERTREAHEVVGPSHEGLLMRIHLQESGTVNQALVPQTIREPYWSTHLDIHRLSSREQVYVATSYGAKLDTDLRNRLTKFWEEHRIHVARKANAATDSLSVLEGNLKLHPKFAYRYYLDGLANGQTCGLTGVDASLKKIQPGTRIRVHGILRSRHFEESAHRQPDAALIVADYIYMDVKHLEPSSRKAEN